MSGRFRPREPHASPEANMESAGQWKKHIMFTALEEADPVFKSAIMAVSAHARDKCVSRARPP